MLVLNEISSLPTFSGLSWEFTETAKSEIKALFFFLESKRILINPADMETKSWCEESAIEIKNKLVDFCAHYDFNAETVDAIRYMVNACNSFLDDMKRVDQQGIIYKNNIGDWENTNFSIAMKKISQGFSRKNFMAFGKIQN